MKVLITGALGHIGSHFIESFSVDWDLILVDNMHTQRYCSLFNLKRNVSFIESDISDLSLKDLDGVDAVVHLASITNAVKSFDNNIKLQLDKDFDSTLRLIDLCLESNVKKFIFPSTTSVYGVASEIVYEDDESVLNPQSPYADMKLRKEKMIQNKLEKSNLKYVILRFGTIFGTSAGIRFHTAVNKFCWQASCNIPITVWRQNINYLRPYLGLDDAKNVVEFFINSQAGLNNIYNIVSCNMKLSDIISLIQKEKPTIEVNPVDTPLLNQFSYEVSTDKIKDLGFEFADCIQYNIQNTMRMLSGIK